MTRYRFLALNIALGVVLCTAAAVWVFRTLNTQPETKEIVSRPSRTSAPDNTTPNPFSPTAGTSAETENIIAKGSADNLKDKNVFRVVSAAPFSLSIIDSVKHYNQLQEYLQQLPSFDSHQIKRVLDELGDGFEGSIYAPALVAAAYQRWSEIDIDSAFDFAIENSTEGGMYGPPDAQGIAILSALNPDYTRTRIDDMEIEDENSHLKYIAYSGIAQQDPERAVREFVESGNDVTRGDEFLYTAMEQWADQDPQAALEFLKTENNDYLTSQFQEQILYQWLDKDADSAILEIENMINGAELGAENMMLASLYTSHLLETDPDAAIQWAISQPDPDVRENIIMSTLYGGGDIDPQEMQNLLHQLSTEDRERMMPMIAPEIARGMAETDPVSALAWVEQLPRAAREHATGNVVSEWMLQNPDAAIDWITNQTDLMNNKAMISNALYPAIYSSPEKGKQIFAKLSPELQMEMIEPMLSMLMGPDEREAQQWLIEQGNPDVQQVGTIMLDMMHGNGNADPIATLDKLVSLPPQSRGTILFQYMHQQVFENKSAVGSWLNQTTALTQKERRIIQDMFDGYDPAVSYGASGYPPNIDCIPEY